MNTRLQESAIKRVSVHDNLRKLCRSHDNFLKYGKCNVFIKFSFLEKRFHPTWQRAEVSRLESTQEGALNLLFEGFCVSETSKTISGQEQSFSWQPKVRRLLRLDCSENQRLTATSDR